MDNSGHDDKAENATFVPHSPGQPRLEHEIQDTAPQAAGPLAKTSDESTHERGRLSTNQIGCVFFQYHTLMQNLMLV